MQYLLRILTPGQEALLQPGPWLGRDCVQFAVILPIILRGIGWGMRGLCECWVQFAAGLIIGDPF